MLAVPGILMASLLATGFTDEMGYMARTHASLSVETVAFVSPVAEKWGVQSDALRNQVQRGLEACGLLPRQGPSSPVNVAAMVMVAGVQLKDGWWASNVHLSLKTTVPAEGTRLAVDLFSDASLVAGAPGSAVTKVGDEVALLVKDACAAWAEGKRRAASRPK